MLFQETCIRHSDAPLLAEYVSWAGPWYESFWVAEIILRHLSWWVFLLKPQDVEPRHIKKVVDVIDSF